MNPQEPQAVPETGKAITKYTAEHGREVGLPSPEAINFMSSVANLLTRSALITPDMGTDPEQIRANAIAKMLVGRGLGIHDPMQCLQDIYIVKGKIFVGYPQMIGIMLRKGFRLEWKERSERRACLSVTPPAEYPMMPEEFEYTFEDAKAAGLTAPSQRTGEPSQYMKRPRVMLAARVVSEAYRATGGGSLYDPSERAEMEVEHTAPSFQHPEESPFKVSPKPAENGAAATDGGVKESTESNRAGSAEPHQQHGKPAAHNAEGIRQTSGERQGGQPGETGDSPGAAEVTSPNRAGESVQAGQTKRGRAKDTPKEGTSKGDTGAGNSASHTGSEAESRTASGNGNTSENRPYQATDEDVPGNIGTPKVVQMERPIMDRLNSLFDGMAALANMDREKVKSPAQVFMREFLHLDRLPKPQDNPAQYAVVLPIMESLADRKRNIAAHAKEMGAESGVGWDQLVRHIDTWPEATKAVAKEVAIRHYPEHPSDVLEFIESNNVEDADLFGFLWIAHRSPALAAKAKEGAVPLAVLVSGLYPEATEQDILSAIAKGSAEDQPELWQ